MEAATAPRCGYPTRTGKPCSKHPRTGTGGGRCERHLGMALPRASQGIFARAFRNKDEVGCYEDYHQEGQGDLHKQLFSFQIVRLQRAAEAESKKKRLDPRLTGLMMELLKASPDDDGAETYDALQHVDFVQKVEEFMSEHPELFLKRLTPGKQEAVRKILAEPQGEAAAPVPPQPDSQTPKTDEPAKA